MSLAHFSRRNLLPHKQPDDREDETDGETHREEPELPQRALASTRTPWFYFVAVALVAVSVRRHEVPLLLAARQTAAHLGLNVGPWDREVVNMDRVGRLERHAAVHAGVWRRCVC